MCVYMYIYTVCVYIYIYMFINIYIYVCICIYMFFVADAFSRQTLFQDGVLLYLAVWEVDREGIF